MAKFCENCGSELQDDQAVCLNCGKFITKDGAPKGVQQNATGHTNTMALSGFIIAMCSLIINLGGLVGVVATILSAIGISQTNTSGEKGKGLAIAGLIVGIFSIIYGLIKVIELVEML